MMIAHPPCTYLSVSGARHMYNKDGSINQDRLKNQNEGLEFVKKLKCKYILISVPCCHYYSDDWFKNWKHRRPDEHIFHFNEI